MIDPLILVKDSLSKLIGESGTNKLNPGKLIAKLTQLTDLSAIEIQQTLLCLSNQNIITGIGPRGIPHKKVGWKNPSQNPAPASRLLVKKVASQVSEDQEVRDIFIKHHKQFNGLKEQDVERILNNLLLLKDTPFTESTDRYIHSARHFLGGSKVLDKLNRLTKELGIELPKDTATYYVLTAGKPNASQVLFIENPRVFNYLKSYANRYSTLLISSYGYGLTLENFADKLENYSLIACPTDNEPQVDLRKALTEKRILYWET